MGGNLKKQFINFFFPILHCCLCGKRSLKEYPGLCADCLTSLLALMAPYRFCPRCLYFYSAHFSRCPQCFGKQPRHYYHHGDVFLPYLAGAAALVKGLKYNNRRYLAETMAALMLSFRDIGEGDAYTLLVPVPSDPRRQRQRGYNQAALLARAFSDLSGIPVAPQTLCKVKDIASQTTLKGRERRANVTGAFAVADGAAVVGRQVILVDDTVTTGATVDECAKVLKQAGARRVKVVAFAAHASPPT